ncbi:PepSY-associated TM helix domain-containing protein [Brytella acorum]|uniref:PepSY-associated TM helix domain-containing protein n=1 Tax=Brytella acorum TaxID=2959299 RepID=A0AA35UPI6_9PROT|nr:PepSY-associated TM helix domain-containing protein [Brytella acorum]MDF3626234.1 PepSY-associated TM helix domain-containing protein [Brytella acorum]CAI9121272.1 PepSY-associated TM helix domain-containing protein [Brytella acorum]
MHRWSGLVCTAFLLVICVTGLPLIFEEEIDHWLDETRPYAAVAADAPRSELKTILSSARERYPGQVVTSVFMDDDEPQVLVTMAPSWLSFNDAPRVGHGLKFDAHTGALLRDDKTVSQVGNSLLPMILHLHRDLFSGLIGALFLALMAIFFILAIVSGVLLYGPFMKRLTFGTIRAGREKGRLAWLDLHNLLGIVLVAWMSVVGLTGALNEISGPLFALWQRATAETLLYPWRMATVPTISALASLDGVVQAAQDAVPEMRVTSVIYPGSRFGARSHYLVWTKGKTSLTSRLYTPVLVEALSGRVTAVVPMPWYLRALEVSRPLHFGDYGGTPLKVIWALFDLVVIAVLVSGVVLWAGKRKVDA